MLVLYVAFLVFCGWVIIGDIIVFSTWDDGDTEAYRNSSVVERIGYIFWISLSWPTRFFHRS